MTDIDQTDNGPSGQDIDRIVAEGLDDDTVPAGSVKVLECPECSRSDLSYVAGMETGHKYQCPHCGYIGVLAIERVRTVEELRRMEGMDGEAGR